MAGQNRNSSQKKKSSGARVAAVTILCVIAATVAGFFYRSLSDKKPVLPHKPEYSTVTPKSPPVLMPHSSVSQPTTIPRVSPQEPITPPPVPITPAREKPWVGEAKLAIIIDDMGNSMAEARTLASIHLPLTFAIIPGLRADRQVAAFAAAEQIETMIHIPMQSKGWPERHLENNGLLVSMDSAEVQERVSGFIQQFPGAVGVNNHMGSEFTGQEDKMNAVLQVLKQHDLFFIDSVTAPESTGWRVAQRLGVRTARRNVFLDNEQERGYILGQLNQAVRMARKNGAAIAICHPHPATISALAAALPGLEKQGIQLVSASQLVK